MIEMMKMSNQDQLKMHSPNLVDANIEKIAALFPNCITETKDENNELKKAIDFDLLKQELSQVIVEGEQERYRLDWVGKKESILTANAPIAKTLRPCREESVNFDKTENLFIEGDNLEALKLLQENYLGKVKMIYIDPPYNTGNDFIYEDDFAESTDAFFEKSNQVDEEGNRLIANTESNGRFHSDWLSMMFSRLKLARNLLSENGLIFISIDNRENSNLRKLCDEVFGASNFISEMIILTGANQSGQGVKIQTNNEYCLVYAKDINTVEVYHVDVVEESLRNLNDAPTPLETRLDMGYTIYYHPDTKDLIPIIDYDKELVHNNIEDLVYKDRVDLLDQGYVKIRPGMRSNKLHRWRWGIETFKARLDEVVITNNKSQYSAKFKQSGFNAPKNIINVSSGTTELKDLFSGGKYFDFPKNTSLIKRLINISTSKEDLVLDFFAGSSTTAHAVMQLNAEDHGNRKFIMVQLPETTDEKSDAYKEGYKNIAEISKERIRRAGKKILEDNADKQGIENLDTGFRVLKIDSTNMKDVYYTPDALKQVDMLDLASNIKEDRTSEDLLFQVMLDWGLELSLPIERKTVAGKQVFYVAGNSLVACFDDLTFDVVDEVAKDHPLRFVSAEKAIHLDHDKTNIKERFKQLSPDTEVKFL